MPEEIRTAETTVNTEVDSHADVDQEPEYASDAEFTDSSEESSLSEKRKPQTKEQNSQNARRRREAERQAELKRVEQEAREKAIIEALEGKNPYTFEEMKDSADVKEFLTMREIERNGGDPLTDFSRFQKQKEKEQAEKDAKDTQERQWYSNDRAQFVEKYPDVNLDALIENEHFQKFADGKVGVVPIVKIYEDFTSFTSDYEKKAKQLATQRVANQKASPGSLSSTRPGNDGYYTKEQVKNMSTEEIKRNYDRVRASMTRWNN